MMNRSMILALLAIIASAAPAGLAAGQQQQLTGRATIGVGETVNPDIIGGGVNFAFSDYTYVHYPTGGEWGEIHSQHLPYPDDEKEWESFEHLMDYAGFQ